MYPRFCNFQVLDCKFCLIISDDHLISYPKKFYCMTTSWNNYNVHTNQMPSLGAIIHSHRCLLFDEWLNSVLSGKKREKLKILKKSLYLYLKSLLCKVIVLRTITFLLFGLNSKIYMSNRGVSMFLSLNDLIVLMTVRTFWKCIISGFVVACLKTEQELYVRMKVLLFRTQLCSIWKVSLHECFVVVFRKCSWWEAQQREIEKAEESSQEVCVASVPDTTFEYLNIN